MEKNPIESVAPRRCEAETNIGRCGRLQRGALEVQPHPLATRQYRARRTVHLCPQHHKQAAGKNGILLGPDGGRWVAAAPVGEGTDR